ncbi:MAG: hypothetical protein AABX69_01705, partial [Nanoarchaeota archaeon]
MIKVKDNQVLSTLLLEPDCDLVVAEPTFIFPPPNGCKLIINPPSSTTTTLPNSGGGSGGGHTSEGFPTAAVTVDLSKDIGKTATVVVRDKDGNTLAQGGPMTIDTEILSMNLVSVNPIPVDSFFDITYELKIDGVPKTKAKCTVINGAVLESLFPTTTTTTTLPECVSNSDCNDFHVCTTDTCVANDCTHSFTPGGTLCRGVAGDCDLAEYCTGSSADCPTDSFAAAGTLCDDGLWCTVSDTCNGSGSCANSQPQNCNDNNQCTTDSCNEVSDICTHAAVDLGTTCGTGACQVTVPRCAFGAPVTCTPGTPSAETCNNLDDDCDGAVDEGLSHSCGTDV